MRLALDWGDVRIGVARCDPAGLLAYPYGTVAAGPDELAELVALVVELAPLEVIVGLPRSLSGADGPAAVKARDRAAVLVQALTAAGRTTPVRLVDERLSTVTAARQLRDSGRRAKDQRAVIDAAAAVTILEHALAAERSRNVPPGELVSAAVVPGQAASSAGGPEDRSQEMP
ncbi:MAG TPA: Holliday junction resolvase RuvX [Propionibacteriaceae bacterium]|nr:Holliday junction resolvase RuvX [Propionibacteriaceae bacterium]